MSGGEVALLNLVTTLDPEKYEPIVVLCSEGPFADNLRESGFETHIFPLSDSVLKTRKDSLGVSSLMQLRKVGDLLQFTYGLANLFRELGADLVHTNSLKADIIGAAAGRLAGIPVIWHVRDRIADDYLPSKVATTFRWLSQFLPTHVITISQAARQTLPPAKTRRATSLEQFSIVHDGVSKHAFRDSEVRNWNSHDQVKIGIVGRISPWKGQHVFIKAAAIVHKQFPNAVFQIVGGALFDENSYASELESLVQASDLNDAVQFLGFRTDILDVIYGLDIVVHASTIGEPFGQVIVEGMAAGKPVIATNGGAVPEIIDDGKSGLLVPSGDEGALADALISLLKSPERAQLLGAAGKTRARDHFSIEKTARGVEKIYEQLLK
jgi:glycosyltransferase involved in cell wall biosynthesis